MGCSQCRALTLFVMVLFTCGIHADARQSYVEACQQSDDPGFCVAMLSSSGLEGQDVSKDSPTQFKLVTSAMQSALDGVNREIETSKSLGGAPPGTTLKSSRKKLASLDDCVEMLVDASELIQACLRSTVGNSTSLSVLDDVHTSLSSALTYQMTCLDGLSELPPGKEAVFTMRGEGNNVGKRMSTALMLLSNVSLSENSMRWEPELLRRKAVTANVVVAQDGTGRFRRIQDAVDAAPSKSSSSYVIYIKAGTYNEKVTVPKSKTNLMFVGDGMGRTIVTGSRSVKDGLSTFRTATVEINANGFLGRDLTIRNTAGPANYQAVALRVSADKAAFYKCSFEGYQDTLYTHVGRQFYKECVVYGTVDFIFGDAAAVFQGCTLLARLPMNKQKNTITAQGRTDPNQNTGLVFQDCTIDGTDDLKRSGQSITYLGRPWQKYSRTVYLRCYESGVLNPAGWLEWSGNFALSTLFYAEYMSKGPGAPNGRRVAWSTQIGPSQAVMYTPGSFISGGQWLGGTSFPYSLGL